jgi:hypothetical protein
MNHRIMFAAIGVVLLAVLPTTSRAQFSLETSLTTMYDDNIQNNYFQISDKISTLNANAGYGMEGNTWSARLFYDGGVNYYQNVIARTNQFHSGNVLFVHNSGDDAENTLSLGLSYGQGSYRESYSFYGHSLLSASANYKQFLSDNIINKVGYTVRLMNFSQLDDFSYSEHAFSANFSFALPTMTTVIVQTDLGAKFYSTSAPEAESGGMRKGMSSITPSVTQMSGMIRAGQSIVEGTGLSLTLRYQWNIQKQTRYLSSEYGVMSDDELFDDHYGYEGLQTSLMLTQVISESMLLKVTGGIHSRLYSSLAAYDLDGTQVAAQRVDQRSYLSVLFQKNFDIGFSLKAAYDLIRNASNDVFYDYRNNAMTLELTVPF